MLFPVALSPGGRMQDLPLPGLLCLQLGSSSAEQLRPLEASPGVLFVGP